MDDLPTLGELFRRADEIGGPMPDKMRQALEVVAAGLLGMLDELEKQEVAYEDAIPTMDDLPELTLGEEAEALAVADRFARQIASDEIVGPPPLSPCQEIQAMVEAAPWGPRPAAPTHRIGGRTISIG